LAPPRPRVVVNADDFGISRPVNSAIGACFEAGRISSATLLANQPWLEEACDLARSKGFVDRLGVHLTLTFGEPLSAAMRDELRGEPTLNLRERRILSSRALQRAIVEEVRAQIQRVVSAGIRPTHIDSHHHILNSFPYAASAITAARDLGITRMRIARNRFISRSPGRVLFKAAYNRFVRWRGMRTTDTFTDVRPLFTHLAAGGRFPGGVVEVMCHPGARLPDEFLPYSSETELLLGPEWGNALRAVDLIGYAQV
jgi:hypothetical protein